MASTTGTLEYRRGLTLEQVEDLQDAMYEQAEQAIADLEDIIVGSDSDKENVEPLQFPSYQECLQDGTVILRRRNEDLSVENEELRYRVDKLEDELRKKNHILYMVAELLEKTSLETKLACK